MKRANLAFFLLPLLLWAGLAPAASLTSDRVEGITVSVAVKAPVKAATTANITLSGTQTIDGVAVVAEDRVLVKNQTTATQNGIYVVKATAWQRAADFDGNRDVAKGTLILVTDGTTNGGYYYKVTTSNPITIGTSSISFSQALIAESSALTFLQSGSGAVSRSAQAKLRGVQISAEDFGAVCDGSTDDGAAINLAITAANALGGGRVYIEGGSTKTCAVAAGSSTIRLRSGVILDLNGATLIRTGTSYTSNTIENYNQGTGLPTVSSITRSSTTATVTTATAHNFRPGDIRTMAAATQAEYNTTHYVLSTPSSTTYTYTVTGSPATPATGSPSLIGGVDRDIGVINGTIRGNGTNDTGTQSHVAPAAGVSFFGVHGFTLENLTFESSNGDCVTWRLAHRGYVNNITCNQFGRNAFSPTSGWDNHVNDFRCMAPGLTGASPGAYVDIEPDSAPETARITFSGLRCKSVTLVDFHTPASGDFAIEAQINGSRIGGDSPSALKIQSTNRVTARNVVVDSGTTIIDSGNTSPSLVIVNNVDGVVIGATLDASQAGGTPRGINVASGTVDSLLFNGRMRGFGSGIGVAVDSGATLSNSVFVGVDASAVTGTGVMSGNSFRASTISNLTLTGATSTGNRFEMGSRVTGTRTYNSSAVETDQYFGDLQENWTATVRGSGTAGTYEIASQISTYTKVGRMVFLNSRITLAGAITGGGTGDLNITNLPWSKRASSVAIGSARLSGPDLATAGASVTVSFAATTSSSTLNFQETADNAASAAIPISAVAANDVIEFSIAYEVQ